LDESTLQEMARGARWREYQAGEVVVLEGEALPGLYYLQYGWLKAVKISPTAVNKYYAFWNREIHLTKSVSLPTSQTRQRPWLWNRPLSG
jgi:hypothetical protein